MRKMLGLLCVMSISVTAGGAPSAPGVQVVLELCDGSRIVGTPAVDRVKVMTPYSTMEVPLAVLRTIELSGTSHGMLHLKFRNGDLISGQLDAAQVAVKAIFGQITLPINELKRIRVIDTRRAMPDGLVLYYPFNTDEGGRVTDMSGEGNDGKVIGASYTSEGKAGGAMSFNGDRQGIVIGNPASLQLQNFTIMAWVKRGSLDKASQAYGMNGHFFSYGTGGYIFGMHPNGQLYLGKIDYEELQSQFVINDDSFHHVAVTKQGSQVIFYLDGVASSELNYDGTFEFETDAAVGARWDLVATFLGVIDEVAVFNRGLSSDEIKGIYNSQK